MYENNVARFVGEIHERFNYKMSKLLHENETDITFEQFMLMTRLWVEDNQTQQFYADAMRRDRSTITRIVDQLETKNFVKRLDSIHDRRIKLIVLTQKGQNLEAKVRPLAISIIMKSLEGLSDEEQDLTMKLLLRIRENLK